MEVDETPTPTPRFATVVRGYDRLQVDDYVEHLHRWIEQADYRAQQCEIVATRANAESEQLRRRLSSVDAGTLTATPGSMKALGDRVGSIMQSSFQAAKDVHRRAEDEVQAAKVAAEETATKVIAEATQRAEELSRAAEDLFVQAQEALAGASSAAARETEEARARALAEGDELIQRARHEARDLARSTAEEEQVRREQLQVLEEHRQRIMEEISVLHQRLGKIGDGLSLPSPAPPQQSQARHRQRQPALEASTAKPPTEHDSKGDDETTVVELPPGGKPTRRRVASSAR
jgi:hypothetical protein